MFVDDDNMDRMDNLKEVGNGTKIIYVIDILDKLPIELVHANTF